MPGGLQLLANDVALASLGATLTATTDSSDYPAVNLLQPARKTVFRLSGTVPGTVDVDINLGSVLGTSVVSGVAAMNVRSDAPSGFEPTIDVYQSASPSFGGAAVATFPGFASFHSKRDKVIKLASGFVAQYWRFRFTTSGYGFSIGKVMLGTLYDLDYFWSPDSALGTVDPSDELRTIDKNPISVAAGEVRYEYSLLFEEVSDADQQMWDAIVQARLPFGMVDALGRNLHARLGGSRRIDFGHKFGINPSLWTFQVPIEIMP